MACGLLAAIVGAFSGVRIIGTSWLDLGYAGVPGSVMSLFGLWATAVSWQARSRGRYSEAVTFLGLVVGGGLIGAVVLDFHGAPQWLAIGAFVPAFTGTLLLPIWFALLGTAHLANPIRGGARVSRAMSVPHRAQHRRRRRRDPPHHHHRPDR